MAITLPKNHAQAAAGDHPMSTLEVAVDQVVEASRDLATLVGQIESRLSPVLLPLPVEKDAAATQEVSPVRSPLVQELHHRAAFLRSVGDDLRGMLHRLEL